MAIHISSFALHNDYPVEIEIDGRMFRVEPKDGSYLYGYVATPLA